MSQQWPPESDASAPDQPTEPTFAAGSDIPAADAQPTAPVPVMPVMPAAVPHTTGRPQTPAPPWTIVEEPPSSSPAATATRTAATPQASRTRTPLILLLVGILLIGGGTAIFALTRGGLGSGAAQATTTPNGNTAFATYTDVDGVYSLNVPRTWLTTGTGALATFGPAGQPGVRMEIERLEVGLSNHADDVASSFFDTAASSSSGSVSNKTGATSVTLAGATWSQYAGDLTSGSTTEHIVLLIAEHRGDTVVLATFAPKDSFSTEDTKSFQPMLKSLTFLK